MCICICVYMSIMGVCVYSVCVVVSVCWYLYGCVCVYACVHVVCVSLHVLYVI